MKTRIITAVVAIACIFPIFWFSDPVAATSPLNYIFPVFMSLVAFISIWEMLHCLGLDKLYAISVPLYLAALAFPVLVRVMRGNTEDFRQIALLTVLAFAVYLFGTMVFTFGKLDMSKIALMYMTAVYVIGAFTGIVYLRDAGTAGRFLFLIPFVFAWVTDTFAYFCGRLFGKHKLIPAVSPKKTVEGAVGGFLFCAVTAILYGVIIGACFDASPNYLVLGIGGALIGVVSQIGDLMMSAIKRKEGIKDYGHMLPGHGGLLDRFDSSIAVTVLVLVVNAYLPFFG